MVRAVVAGILLACAAVAALVAAFAVTDSLAQRPESRQAQGPEKVWKPGEVHTGNTLICVHVFNATSFGHEHAVVGKVKEGEIHLGAAQNAGHVIADLTSFLADPEYARKLIGLPGESDADTQKQVTTNMLGREVLDVLQFPTASATLESVRLLPQKSNNGLPQYYTCMSGASSGTNVLAAAQAACGGASSVWFPDLRRSTSSLGFGVMVKF